MSATARRNGLLDRKGGVEDVELRDVKWSNLQQLGRGLTGESRPGPKKHPQIATLGTGRVFCL